MDERMLFIDGSVDNMSHVGYGACLAVSEAGLSLDSLRERVKVKRFADTASTRLELQTLLWALGDPHLRGRKLIVYTDSQNIMGLQGRRGRLEQNDYHSKKNKRLNNFVLYQQFFRTVDRLDCEFVKVRGHRASSRKGGIDRIFALVDRASRYALRADTP